MSILVVDDSSDSRLLIQAFLKEKGYMDVILTESVAEALKVLYKQSTKGLNEIELILMDLVMPEMDGIEACRRFKQDEILRDIPIIMVTASGEMENLERAFAAGAIDFITKPLKKIELLASVRSVLKLKHEMDQRKDREEELRRLTSLDGLTGIANRRWFDEFLETAWRHGMRNHQYVSLIMLDIDYFKFYNDTYGHQAGDDCLKKVAKTIHDEVKETFGLAARYGGEEFAVVLTATELDRAIETGEQVRQAIAGLGIPHSRSAVANSVTVSVGVASILPWPELTPEMLIKAADNALYCAKQSGRNQVQSQYHR